MGRKKPRTFARPYIPGELNKAVDALLHPLVRIDPWFLVLDGVVNGPNERNSSETVAKFIKHNLPTCMAELSSKRRDT